MSSTYRRSALSSSLARNVWSVSQNSCQRCCAATASYPDGPLVASSIRSA